jgi:hypothetical protein
MDNDALRQRQDAEYKLRSHPWDRPIEEQIVEAERRLQQEHDWLVLEDWQLGPNGREQCRQRIAFLTEEITRLRGLALLALRRAAE